MSKTAVRKIIYSRFYQGTSANRQTAARKQQKPKT